MAILAEAPRRSSSPGSSVVFTRDAVRAGRVAIALGRVGVLPTVVSHDQHLVELLQDVEVPLLIVDVDAVVSLGRDVEQWFATVRSHCDGPILALVDRAPVTLTSLLRAGATATAPLWLDDDELGSQARSLLGLADGHVGAIHRWGPLELDHGRRRVRFAGVEVALTPLQFRILAVLVAAEGRVVPHATFYRLVWREPLDDDGQRLGAHIHRIRHRLGDDPPRFLLTVRGEGFRLADEVPVDANGNGRSSAVGELSGSASQVVGPAVRGRP